MSQIELHTCSQAPRPLGNYSHAVSFGQLVIVSGIAARDFVTDAIPGLKLGPHGEKLSYDIRAETRATLLNIESILKEAGSGLDCVLEVNTYLLEMKDFAAYNEIYSEFFSRHRPARTTIGVASLPGNIAIEMKVMAIRRGMHGSAAV